MAHPARVTFGTLFQFNELALKQAKEFARSFNVKQIKYIQAKLMKVTQEMEALENRTTRTDLGEGPRGVQAPFFVVFQSVSVTNNTIPSNRLLIGGIYSIRLSIYFYFISRSFPYLKYILS